MPALVSSRLSVVSFKFEKKRRKKGGGWKLKIESPNRRGSALLKLPPLW